MQGKARKEQITAESKKGEKTNKQICGLSKRQPRLAYKCLVRASNPVTGHGFIETALLGQLEEKRPKIMSNCIIHGTM